MVRVRVRVRVTRHFIKLFVKQIPLVLLRDGQDKVAVENFASVSQSKGMHLRVRV